MLSKLHHSMADGVSVTDLYQLMLDATPKPQPPVADDWRPRKPASTVLFTAAAAAEMVTSTTRAVAALLRAVRTPRRSIREAAATATGLLTLAGATRPIHASSLTGPLDASRRYVYVKTNMADFAAVRHSLHVSVNDVALAAVSGGFRALLESRGEVPDEHAVRSLVPVSTRAPGQQSVPDNQVSLMLPYLPVDLADPRERLNAVHKRVQTLRARHEPEAGEAITRAAEHGPFAPVAWGIRLGIRLPQRQVATVTTNVPGPRQTLYALGRELVELLPYVPIADRVRIGVAMFSYRDDLVFGLTGDYGTAADLPVLASAITTSMEELAGLAQTTETTT